MKLIQHLSPTMRIAFVHLSLMALAGLFVIGSLLVDPSQEGGFLGFSSGRWVIIFANLLALAGILFFANKVWRREAGKLETWLSSERHLFWLFFLALILFCTSFPAGMGTIPAIRYFAYFGRLQPSLLWLTLASGAVWLTLGVVLRTPILCWFRQFFPFDTAVQEVPRLTRIQHYTIVGIAVIYAALQVVSTLQVREALWLPDSIDYIFPAETFTWTEPGLWTHTKPWGAAVLYKLTGSSPATIDAVQTIVSALAWLALAWIFSRFIRVRWLRVTAFGFTLGFSLAPSVQMWNHIIQSESLSISLMVLILAVWLSLLQNWRWEKLFALIFLFAWWIGTRETNVYLSLMTAGILVLVGLFYKRQRFYWAVSALLVFFCYVNMQISEVPTLPRWLYPLTNTVLNRILPNEEFRGYFEYFGMPVTPELLSLSGGFANSENFAVYNNPALDDMERWLYKRGKDVYIQFLIAHPAYTLTSPWTHIDELLTPSELLNYAPDRYSPVIAWLFGKVFFPNSLWLVLLLVLLTLVFTIMAKPWKGPSAFWLVLGFLVLFFPHFYLAWHGDAAEVGRHAIQASVQLRTSLWLLLWLALDTVKIRNTL
jgi:hypothetical protein